MSFNIKISNGKGKFFNISVTKADTIGNAKNKAGHTPIDNWKWKCNGSILKNDKTMEFYEIEEDDFILATVNQIGGEPYK